MAHAYSSSSALALLVPRGVREEGSRESGKGMECECVVRWWGVVGKYRGCEELDHLAGPVCEYLQNSYLEWHEEDQAEDHAAASGHEDEGKQDE